MNSAAVTSKTIRKIILEQSKRAHVGHIGSGLAIADIIAALFSGGLDIRNPEDPDRDRFILSKGHAALALYAALLLRGWLTQEDLDSFCTDGSLLGVHPEKELRGIDFGTGSLGTGLSFGVGAAVAARAQKSERKIVVLISDAECNEGSVWEAAMFAAHHKLSNLTVIIDADGQQAFGYTKDVLDLSPLKDRWSAFGWEAADIDGHDPEVLRKAITAPPGAGPRALIANTVFGKGVPFMENKIKWHYWPMSDDEYAIAMDAIGAHRA